MCRHELLRALAHTEAVIDFGDDDRESDINDDAMWALTPKIEQVKSEISVHLRDGKRGELVRDGVRIALAGPPNAGTQWNEAKWHATLNSTLHSLEYRKVLANECACGSACCDSESHRWHHQVSDNR